MRKVTLSWIAVASLLVPLLAQAEAARSDAAVRVPKFERVVLPNGARLHELTERLVRMEGHADEIHAAGLKRLFKEYGSSDTMRFLIARELFRHLERVTDSFEDVANEIDGLVIDHA